MNKQTEASRYKVVGWYSSNPHNEHVTPFARVVYVRASTKSEAFRLGEAELNELYDRENKSVDFLNWYIEKLPEIPVGTPDCTHQWEEQPGEPPIDVCTSCGLARQ